MRLRALWLLLGALILVSGAARAYDRGQFEDVPDDIRAWFKGVRSPTGAFCCDISDGHRTIYEVRAGGFGCRSKVCGGPCRRRRWFETQAIRWAKRLSGMSVFAAISKSVVSSRPMLVRHLVPPRNENHGSEIHCAALDGGRPRDGHGRHRAKLPNPGGHVVCSFRSKLPLFVLVHSGFITD